jgi:hypothetical protein
MRRASLAHLPQSARAAHVGRLLCFSREWQGLDLSLRGIQIIEHPRFAVQGDGDSWAESNVKAIAPQYDDQARGVFLPLAP